MARKNIAAGNWKMNTTLGEGLILLTDIGQHLLNEPATADEVIICPPFLHLPDAANIIDEAELPISLGAQDCHHMAKGAFTGEISAQMLHSAGVQYVLIGHSERRHYCGETDQTLSAKVKSALEAKLNIIFCCGETLEQRENGDYLEIIANQLRNGLFPASSGQCDCVTVAYEPVWAIGTGKTATPEDAQAVHAHIRMVLGEGFGEDADEISILYGGSVSVATAKALFAQPDIDGGLVGGASLVAADFAAISRSFGN